MTVGVGWEGQKDGERVRVWKGVGEGRIMREEG